MATKLEFSSPEIERRIEQWTSPPYDEATRREIQALIDAGDVKELEDRFYATLEFGTGGLRGIVGAGSNRMNSVVVAQATQGLAHYVKEHATRAGELRAAIAHDCRHFSREFAETAAGVLAANGFTVFICPELRPTPWLSFAVRRLGCHTGIVVTASHNPKEYNGYKVYWEDGSQVVPPHDKGIIREVGKVTSPDQVSMMNSFRDGVEQGSIKILGEEMDRAYLEAVLESRIDAEAIANNPVRLAFTPLHGAGGTIAPRAFEQWGFTEVHYEEEQMKPDGDFPTAASPNPEEGEALGRAIELARRVEGEVVLATDPDADRLGIAVRHEGDYRLVTGNQLSALLCDYILSRRRERGALPEKPGVVSTIVTTPLVGEIAAHYGAEYAETLTGFKWIADRIRQWEKARPEIEFLYGTEESYGYLIGNHARDKDGIVAACLTGEMAAWARGEGMTPIDYLERLYLRHRPRLEWQKSIYMTGREGAERIKAVMEGIRAEPPREIDGRRVVRRTRIDKGEIYDGQTGEQIGRVNLPSSDVVILELADGARAIARPSGTEPKIKFYFFLVGEKQSDAAGVRRCLKELESSRPGFQQAFLKAVGVE